MSEKSKALADILHGCEYGSEGSRDIFEQAKKDNLLVIFGYSDDSIMTEGIDQDQHYNKIILDADGQVHTADEDEFDAEDMLDANGINYEVINAIFSPPDQQYTFVYETEIPHDTFDVMEGSEKYCKGIVIDVSDFIDNNTTNLTLYSSFADQVESQLTRSINVEGPCTINLYEPLKIELITKSYIGESGDG